jgi:tetratricopeptide (TPR) repeat protein
MNDFIQDGAPPPRRRARAVVPIVALVVMAGAGAAIWMSIKDDLKQALAASGSAQAPAPATSTQTPATAEVKKPAPADDIPAGRPIGEDELAFWSDVTIYKAGPGRPRPIVVVKRGKQPIAVDEETFFQGLLAREIVRQGLLLAAREELGAQTRDVPIGDPDVSGTPDAAFRIGSRFRTLLYATDKDPAHGRITIVEGSGAGRRVLWSGEFDCVMNIAPTYPLLVMFVERISREAFPKVLKTFGVTRSGPVPPRNTAEGGLPPGVEERLSALVETEAFAAIRALHEAIRTKGETSALLITLARAYANLGSLSESQWTADDQAFQARGLLYAQRAAVRDHDAPPSLRGRAYVEALAGLPAQALADLNDADKADGGKGRPPWAEVIGAYCHSDAHALGQLVTARPDDPLPRYLRFLNLLHSSGRFYERDKVCRNEVIAAGRELLAKVPDCFRVHDGMASREGVANLHSSTSLPLEQYVKAIPTRLAKVPGLPPKAAARMTDGVFDEVGLRNGLVAAAADDPSDLTWGVLARQLRELRYLLVCRRIHFVAFSLAADATDFAAESLPLVADHPHRAYIEGAAEGFASPDLPRQLRALDLADFEWKANDMMAVLRSRVPDLAKTLDLATWYHTNLGTVPGQGHRTEVVKDDKYRGVDAHNLLRFDPDSPLGRGALIETRWDEARPNVEAWEKDHGGGDTFVIAQLGFHDLKEGKLDNAERRLEAALARSPDRWIFDGLVEVYRKTGRIDGWKKAVDQFLKGEDQNLDHAHATADLASFLMKKGLYVEARPYAERAASSWAAWAMPVASRCAEKQGDWKTAELWVARTSQRYASNWFDWFVWCHRTGHGDARAAAALIEAQVEAGRSPASSSQQLGVALVYLLDDRPEEARKFLEEAFEKDHDTLTGVWLTWACDLAGDVKARNATMKAITAGKPASPRMARIVGVLADWLSKGEKTSPDLKQIDAILEEIKPERRPASAVIVGLLLDRHGKRDEALRYLKLADAAPLDPWFRFPVRAALRARRIEPAAMPLPDEQ